MMDCWCRYDRPLSTLSVTTEICSSSNVHRFVCIMSLTDPTSQLSIKIHSSSAASLRHDPKYDTMLGCLHFLSTSISFSSSAAVADSASDTILSAITKPESLCVASHTDPYAPFPSRMEREKTLVGSPSWFHCRSVDTCWLCVVAKGMEMRPSSPTPPNLATKEESAATQALPRSRESARNLRRRPDSPPTARSNTMRSFFLPGTLTTSQPDEMVTSPA
mmetsp:Transcript_2474/g.7894  ORF Transcript_2474/g.7894 Transcript_2474/m.7894 type:complete len:219 (-) Transcript_2474:302-958(-)